MTKVGIPYNKPKAQNRRLAEKGEEFVSVVDGITFGALDGRPFHTGRHEWTIEDQKRWAESNAFFFDKLASNLRSFAALLPNPKGKAKR